MHMKTSCSLHSTYRFPVAVVSVPFFASTAWLSSASAGLFAAVMVSSEHFLKKSFQLPDSMAVIPDLLGPESALHMTVLMSPTEHDVGVLK